MKLSKLSKIRMPEDKKPEMAEFDMDSSDEAGADSNEPALEAEGEVSEDMEPMDLDHSNPDLEKFEDDELMAEIKKRGLMSQLSSPSKKPEPDFKM